MSTCDRYKGNKDLKKSMKGYFLSKNLILYQYPKFFFLSSLNTSAFDYFTPKFALAVCITFRASSIVITLLVLAFFF